MKISTYFDNHLTYSEQPPYHPPQSFPELALLRGGLPIFPANKVYSAIRRSLLMINLDKDRYGTENWNPLGELIKPGDRVVLKPNLVLHHRPSINDKDSITTHGSVIRAVIDYVFLALKGEGEIIIADTPLQAANFEKLVREAGLDTIQEFYDKAFQQWQETPNILLRTL